MACRTSSIDSKPFKGYWSFTASNVCDAVESASKSALNSSKSDFKGMI